VAFIPLYDSNPLRNISRPWVAWGILAANVLVFFLVEDGNFIGEPRRASVGAFGLIPAVINGYAHKPVELAGLPDWITFITYAFIHADFWHLAGNMIFLWVFADNVEDALGHVRYILFYLLCSVVSGYAFVVSDPMSEAPVIGASGAIAANIGAYLLLHPRAKIWVLILLRIPLRLRAIWIIGFWIAVQFLSALNADADDQVAWWAHIGGLATGMILVLFMRQRGVPLFAPAPNETAPHLFHFHRQEPAVAPAAAARSPPEPPAASGPWA